MSEPSLDKKGKKKAAFKATPATPTPITPISVQELAGEGLPQGPSSSKEIGKSSVLSSSASLTKKGLEGAAAKSTSVKRAAEDDGLPVVEKKLKLMEIVKEIAIEIPSSQHEHGENINFRLDKLSSILKCYRDSLVFKSPEDIQERLMEEKKEFLKRK